MARVSRGKKETFATAGKVSGSPARPPAVAAAVADTEPAIFTPVTAASAAAEMPQRVQPAGATNGQGQEASPQNSLQGYIDEANPSRCTTLSKRRSMMERSTSPVFSVEREARAK